MFVSLITAVLIASPSHAAPAASNSCADLPSRETLVKALKAARGEKNGGLNNEMWGVIVDRTGATCAVAYTGADVDSQWPGSRMIAEQKANTANAFSTKAFALSTANLWAGVQPGGFLFEITASNPVNQAVAYKGDASKFGSAQDPWVGEHVGGVIVFGGGLALYDDKGTILGAVGVSGDTSCADHNIAWRTRKNLNLDFVPAGASKQKDDSIIYDVNSSGKSKSGYGHAKCGNDEEKIAGRLPAVAKKK